MKSGMKKSKNGSAKKTLAADSPRTHKLDTATKNAIIADRLAGLPNEIVGRKYGLHPVSVSRMFGQFKKLTAPKSEIHQTTENWRDRLKQKSIAAIDAGLDPNPDKYKAGNLGVSVMKGIGEFAGEQMPGISITFEPGALDWIKPKLVGSGSTDGRQSAMPVADATALPEKTSGGENGNAERQGPKSRKGSLMHSKKMCLAV